MNLSGFLNLNKPSGCTSRDVVNRVDRVLREAAVAAGLSPKLAPKAGHAGTLDPLASGVLVVAVGSATRLIEYVQDSRKEYVGTFLLGRQSPTEDIDGEVVELVNPPQPTREQLVEAAQRFVGRIEQRPPAYSALKVQGQRAYDLARAGKTVELAPRTIEVDRLDVLEYEYPRLMLDVVCSGGTYVRSLGRDLASAVGTMSVMSALVRTRVGDFRLQDALPPAELSAEGLAGALRPLEHAVAGLPRATLSAELAARIRQGQTISLPEAPEAGEIAAVNESGALLAILVRRAEGGWRPLKNLTP